MKTISEALSYVQKHLKAPKNQRNNFGKYNYRSCEDILEGLKAVMPENAFVTMNDETWHVGDRFYIKTTATFHFGGESVSTTALARECLNKKGMDDAQLTGSCSSYARKYALNGLFLIDDNKDPDTDEQHKQTNRPEPTKPTKPAETPKDVLPIVNEIVKFYTSESWSGAKEILGDLTPDEKKKVWSALSGPVRIWITTNSKGQ